MVVNNIPVTFKVYTPIDDNVSTFTHAYWEKASSGAFTAGVFFEIVSPVVGVSDGRMLVQGFWEAFTKEYNKGQDFEKALGKAVSHLQEALETVGLKDGIDANFVVFVNEQNPDDPSKTLLKIAVVGELDLLLIRGDKFSDLTEYLDINTDLTQIEYNELDLEDGDILLISNKGVLTNLLYGGVLDLSSPQQLINGLESLMDHIPGGKKIAMMLLGELDTKALDARQKLATDKHAVLPKVGVGALFRDKLQSVAGGFGSIKDRAVSLWKGLRSKKEAMAVSSPKAPIRGVVLPKPEGATTAALAEGGMSSETSTTGAAAAAAGMAQSALAAMQKGREGSDQGAASRLDATAKGNQAEVKQPSAFGSAARVEEEVEIKIQPQPTPAEEHGVPSIQRGQDPTPAGVQDTQIHTQPPAGAALGVTNEANLSQAGHKGSRAAIGAPTRVEDPVSYLRQRRSLGYRISSKVGGLFSALGKLRRKSHVRTLGRVDARGYGASSPKGMFKIYAVLGVLALIYLGIWYRKYSLRKYDSQLLSEFKQQYYSPIVELYNNKVSKLVATDPNNYIGQCFDMVDRLNSAYESYKVNFKIKDSALELEAYKEEAQKYKEKCKQQYYVLYNITKLQEGQLPVLKDFKVALGEDASPIDVDVYQGVIVVLDAGKKAVYKVNPENGELTLYKDEAEESLVEPAAVAIGQETIFVCDRTKGVLFYNNKKNRFDVIRGTDPDTLGASCTKLDTFGKNVYFVTDAGDTVYKVVGLGGLRFAPPAKYIQYDQGNIKDLTIDGSIYTLVELADGTYDILRFYGGRYDSAFRIEADTKQRFGTLEAIFTNPAGTFPIYAYDSKLNSVFVIEKPTKEKHPGVGVLTATYELPDGYAKVDDIAAHLSIVTNKETRLYMLIDGSLRYLQLQ